MFIDTYGMRSAGHRRTLAWLTATWLSIRIRNKLRLVDSYIALAFSLHTVTVRSARSPLRYALLGMEHMNESYNGLIYTCFLIGRSALLCGKFWIVQKKGSNHDRAKTGGGQAFPKGKAARLHTRQVRSLKRGERRLPHLKHR